MTKLDFLDVIRAIETVKENEKIFTDRYIILNPDDRENAARDLDLMHYALDRAILEIERRYKKGGSKK